jgi:hypothetical protein
LVANCIIRFKLQSADRALLVRLVTDAYLDCVCLLLALTKSLLGCSSLDHNFLDEDIRTQRSDLHHSDPGEFGVSLSQMVQLIADRGGEGAQRLNTVLGAAQVAWQPSFLLHLNTISIRALPLFVEHSLLEPRPDPLALTAQKLSFLFRDFP